MTHFAGEDDYSNFRVISSLVESPAQLLDCLRSEGVSSLWSVDRNLYRSYITQKLVYGMRLTPPKNHWV